MKLKNTFQKVFPVLVVAATIFATPTGSFALETTPTVSAASPADSTQDKNLVGNQALAIPASEVSESTDFDTAMATLSHYLVYRADGQRHFDTEKAKEENASHYLLVAGENLNRVADNNEVMIYSLETRDMPGYGNWCGPGHSGQVPQSILSTLSAKSMINAMVREDTSLAHATGSWFKEFVKTGANSMESEKTRWPLLLLHISIPPRAIH